MSPKAPPSKRDRELESENKEVQFKYPFAVSTNNSKPIESRFLLSLRTKNDFNDVNKFSAANTV